MHGGGRCRRRRDATPQRRSAAGFLDRSAIPTTATLDASVAIGSFTPSPVVLRARIGAALASPAPLAIANITTLL